MPYQMAVCTASGRSFLAIATKKYGGETFDVSKLDLCMTDKGYAAFLKT